jgi:hypothetical protein
MTYARSFQVGVSPAFLNLGEIGRGESRRGTFSITTSSDEGFLVYITAEKGGMDFFDGRYKDMLVEYSEEDASSWINFLNHPVFLEPDPERKSTSVMGQEQINFILNVPDDAEPGYHLVEITPKPKPPSGWSTAVNIMAITKISLLFKVAGEVERSGEILDVSARNTGLRTRFDVYFQNTGSVSMFVKADDIDLYDTEGNLLYNAESSKGLSSPGEVLKLTGLVTKNTKPGSYLAFTNVTFSTGHAAKDTDIWIAPTEAPAAAAPAQPPIETAFPWWIIVIVIVIIAYIIYRYI